VPLIINASMSNGKNVTYHFGGVAIRDAKDVNGCWIYLSSY